MYSAHHLLMRIAQNALIESESGKAGRKQAVSREKALVSIAFAAFALEAFANAAGKILFEGSKNYGEFEVLNFANKIESLCVTLSAGWHKNKEPWSTVCWLIGFRHKIVHSKPELISIERIMDTDAFE